MTVITQLTRGATAGVSTGEGGTGGERLGEGANTSKGEGMGEEGLGGGKLDGCIMHQVHTS